MGHISLTHLVVELISTLENKDNALRRTVKKGSYFKEKFLSTHSFLLMVGLFCHDKILL